MLSKIWHFEIIKYVSQYILINKIIKTVVEWSSADEHPLVLRKQSIGCVLEKDFSLLADVDHFIDFPLLKENSKAVFCHKSMNNFKNHSPRDIH